MRVLRWRRSLKVKKHHKKWENKNFQKWIDGILFFVEPKHYLPFFCWKVFWFSKVCIVSNDLASWMQYHIPLRIVCSSGRGVVDVPSLSFPVLTSVASSFIVRFYSIQLAICFMFSVHDSAISSSNGSFFDALSMHIVWWTLCNTCSIWSDWSRSTATCAVCEQAPILSLAMVFLS